MAQAPYALRLPANLRTLLEIEAAKHEQTLASYIVGACWAQLERHGGDGRERPDVLFMPADQTSAADVAAVSEASRLARGLPDPKPDMQALRDICAGKVQVQEKSAGDAGAIEVPICGKTWWEDGEHWECLMDAEHKELMHGRRGLLRKLDS